MAKQAGRPWNSPSWRIVLGVVVETAPSEVSGSTAVTAALKEEAVETAIVEGPEERKREASR